MGTLWKVTFVAGAIGWLASAKPASAEFIGTVASILGQATSGSDYLPAVDLTGWFLTFDPSNEWTSQTNIETMQSWLVIAEEAASNPALIQQFYGWGMESNATPDSQPSPTWQSLISSAATPSVPAAQPGVASEPDTLGLFGTALVIAAGCGLARLRKKNRHSPYVSLRRIS